MVRAATRDAQNRELVQPQGVPAQAGQCGVQGRPHQWPTCAGHGCRSMPVSSACVQTMHPGPANEPPTDDQEGLTASWRSGL